MIKELNYYDFRDLSLRLSYYPETYRITFLCLNEEDRAFFVKLIKSITGLEPTINTKKDISFCNNYVYIRLFNKSFTGCHFLGSRSNVIITDLCIESDFFKEIVAPMCNISPTQMIYTYNKNALSNFEEFHNRIQKMWEKEKF